MAAAAMESLELFRAEDEELVAIVENDTCGVDALQCVVGYTFGKGNRLFRDDGKHVYTIYIHLFLYDGLKKKQFTF
jgi:formylmethanofuran dehydrogenase subunit E